jgi:hypothetical protein
MTIKLTSKQQEALDNLKANGPLYVGYNSRTVMNIFNALVKKGLATSSQDGQGINYQAK